MKKRALACSNKKKGYGGMINAKFRVWYDKENDCIELHSRRDYYKSHSLISITYPNDDVHLYVHQAFTNDLEINSQLEIMHSLSVKPIPTKISHLFMDYSGLGRAQLYKNYKVCTPGIIVKHREVFKFNPKTHVIYEVPKYTMIVPDPGINQKITNWSKKFRAHTEAVFRVAGIPPKYRTQYEKYRPTDSNNYIPYWFIWESIKSHETESVSMFSYLLRMYELESKPSVKEITELFSYQEWCYEFKFKGVRKPLQKLINRYRHDMLLHLNGVHSFEITQNTGKTTMLHEEDIKQITPQINAAIKVLPNKKDFNVVRKDYEIMIFNIKTKLSITISDNSNNQALQEALDFLRQSDSLEELINGSSQNRTISGASAI